VIDELDEPGTGLGLQAFGVEQGPVGVLDLALHPGRDLGQDISCAMNKTLLTQRLGEGLLDRGDQAGRAVTDDQQRGGQTAILEVGEEVVPGVGGLAAGSATAALTSTWTPSTATPSPRRPGPHHAKPGEENRAAVVTTARKALADTEAKCP
jgi:hypothetical protein